MSQCIGVAWARFTTSHSRAKSLRVSRLGTSRPVFSERFNRGDDVIDQIFSGSPITLAKNLEWEKANTAASNLRSLGALVYVLDEQGNTVEIGERRTANDAVSAVVESVASAEITKPQENENTNPYDLTATAKVRHLTQITDKRVVQTPPETNIRKTRLRYRFDTFMAKGGGSIFYALTAVFVVTFLLIGVLRGVLLLVFPEVGLQHDDIGFLGNLYITFLENKPIQAIWLRTSIPQLPTKYLQSWLVSPVSSCCLR